MKTERTQSPGWNRTAALLSMLLLAAMLTGCCGKSAEIDLVLAMSNGNLDKSEKITAQELSIIINQHFGKVNVRILDSSYSLPDNGKVVELSGQTHCGTGGDEKAETGDWDCDDYAIAAMVPLRNYAFGTMYVKTSAGGRHALNVFVNRNREVVYWEPQSCEYYHGTFYKPDLIIF